MSQYQAIKAATNAYIKTNGRQEITGAILNAVMIATIDSLGKFYQFVGNAVPDTDPGTIDQNIAYLAGTHGTYTHMGGFHLDEGEVAVIKYDGTWKKDVVFIIPTLISQLFNDVGFITNAVSDLVNYYTKSETFSKNEILVNYYDKGAVDDLVNAITRQSYIVAWDGTAEPDVTQIPFGISVTYGGNPYTGTLEADESTISKIYMVSNGVGYDLYVTTENGGYSWVGIGASSLDLSGYVTKDDLFQLDARLEKVAIPTTATGMKINTNGNPGTSLPSPTANASYRYMKFPVVEGDIVYVNALAGSSPRAWCFVDSGDIIISHESYSGSQVVKTLVAPADSAYVIINDQSNSTSYYLSKDSLAYKLGDLENDISNLDARIDKVEDNFEDVDVETQNTPLSNTQYESGTSTFSGWGMPLCDNTTIKKVTINVKNRDVNAMTSVHFWLRKDSGTGDILAEKTIPVNIAADASADVECEFDAPASYSGVIFLQYACDTLITRLGWTDASGYPYKHSLGYAYCGYFGNGGTLWHTGNADESAFWVKYVEVVTQLSDKQVENLEQRMNINPVGIVDVDVPDTIYAVVGDTLQLYYKSIFRCVDPYTYDIKVTCNIGSQFPRYYEVKPNSNQVGDHSISFVIKDNNNNILGTKTANLKVVNKSSNPGTKNILCVGASNTSGGQWVAELKKRLTTSSGTPTTKDGSTLFTPIGFSIPNINFVGRKVANGVNLEATGGYNFKTYIQDGVAYVRFFFTQEQAPTLAIGDTYTDGTTIFTAEEINIPDLSQLQGYYGNINFSVAILPVNVGLILTRVSGSGDASVTASAYSMSGNPFVNNGVIDIQNYADTYCNGQIDIVYTELFGNGLVKQYQTDFTETFSYMQSFVDMILADFPGCKFCINIMQNKDEKGGLGVNYGAGTNEYAYPYGLKYGCHNLLVKLQEYIKDNNLENTIFIVNTLNEFDCENDYRQTQKQVNPRSGVTEIFGVNGAHPSDIGYYQMADAAVRAFIAHFCQ